VKLLVIMEQSEKNQVNYTATKRYRNLKERGKNSRKLIKQICTCLVEK